MTDVAEEQAERAPSGREPITWIDVARKLSTLEPVSTEWDQRPKCLVRAQVDWTGIILEVQNNVNQETILKWLASVFPSRVENGANGASPYLRLDGPAYAEKLPIEIEVRTDIDGVALPFLGSIDSRISLDDSPYRPHSLSVPIVACHSVKGGTG
ncbi:hypothetical protein, partial [Bradyrhizobium sp. P5_C12]